MSEARIKAGIWVSMALRMGNGSGRYGAVLWGVAAMQCLAILTALTVGSRSRASPGPSRR